MNMTLTLLITDDEIAKFTSFMEGMAKRTRREKILPILQRHLEPVVQRERDIMSPRSKSGALVASLSARVAGGKADRPNTMTAFSAPTATSKQLEATWRGATARRQQTKWALPKKRRRGRVFYAPIVHQGHRIVKRNAAGELYDTGKTTRAVPFAEEAMDALGESEGSAATEEIMDQVLGES